MLRILVLALRLLECKAAGPIANTCFRVLRTNLSSSHQLSKLCKAVMHKQYFEGKGARNRS